MIDDNSLLSPSSVLLLLLLLLAMPNCATNTCCFSFCFCCTKSTPPRRIATAEVLVLKVVADCGCGGGTNPVTEINSTCSSTQLIVNVIFIVILIEKTVKNVIQFVV